MFQAPSLWSLVPAAPGHSCRDLGSGCANTVTGWFWGRTGSRTGEVPACSWEKQRQLPRGCQELLKANQAARGMKPAASAHYGQETEAVIPPGAPSRAGPCLSSLPHYE